MCSVFRVKEKELKDAKQEQELKVGFTVSVYSYADNTTKIHKAPDNKGPVADKHARISNLVVSHDISHAEMMTLLMRGLENGREELTSDMRLPVVIKNMQSNTIKKSNAQMLKCSNVPLFNCSTVQLLKCSSVQLRLPNNSKR